MMTATRIRVVLAAVVVTAFAAPRSAGAQSAEAEALFQEGKRLMKNGEVAKACEKFEAGDRVEPTAGNELNLARCREANGQSAAAWAVYLKAAATAKHAGDFRREAEARKKAASLEPHLVYLTIAVPQDSRVEGLMIKRNDVPVDEALWDQRIPVDPGEYVISGEAPGRKLWSTTVAVLTKHRKIEVPQLERRIESRPAEPKPEVRHDPPAPSEDSSRPPVSRPREPDVAPASQSPAPPPPTSSLRKLPLVVAGVGVAAIGVAVGLGLHARSLEGDSDALCPTTSCNQAHGVDLNKSARRYGLAANIGYAVGGAAVVGAAALWFFGPKSHETLSVLPTLDAHHVGIGFARSF